MRYFLALLFAVLPVYGQRTPLSIKGNVVNNPNLIDSGSIALTTSGSSISINVTNAQVIDMRMAGAHLDGVTDDSAFISNAIVALGALGGTVNIPGKCAFNILLATNRNIRLIGSGSIKDFQTGPPTSYWTPFNTNTPLIQVGNDSSSVKGFCIQNATLYANYGPKAGLYLAGGVEEAFLNNITVWGFKTNFLFKAGASNPSSLIFVNNFLTQCSEQINARAIYAQMPLNQASYTTAIFFDNGHVLGSSTAAGSLVMEVDGTIVDVGGCYFDMTSGHGIKFSKTFTGTLDPYIIASGAHFDGSGTIFECNTETPIPSQWIHGVASINGSAKFKMPSTALVSAMPGDVLLPYASEANYFQVTGALTFRDAATEDGFLQNVQFFRSGTQFTEENKVGANYFRAANGFVFYPTNNGTVFTGGNDHSFRLTDAYLFLDNNRAIYIKDSGGVDQPVLSPSGDNIVLHGKTTLSLTAGGAINLTPTTSFSVTGGSGQTVTLATADVYIDNNRNILFKDFGGTYRNVLQVSSANVVTLINQMGGALKLQANDGTTGDIYMIAGGVTRWLFDHGGNLLPQSTSDIGTSSARAGVGYFTTLNASGTTTIGGGTAINKVLSATATLDFPSTLAQTDSDLTVPVTGASVGDVVSLGVPDGSTISGSCYSAWVSAADTVKVRFSVYGITAKDPASGTFRVQVTKF